MKKIILALTLCAAAVLPALAGTLDNAPFKIIVPGPGWILADATAQDVGQNASLVASLIETNSTLRSIVIKTTLDGVSPSATADLLAGIRDSLTRPDVKNLVEQDVTFVGIKARRFIYNITQNDQVLYSDTIVFINGNAGWTIDCIGPISRKDDINKMLTYYRKSGQ